MAIEDDKRHRRSIRLRGYDYARGGAYFVTICAARRKPVFGHIRNSAMILNDYGRIVAEEWARTAELRESVELDEFVVMPNHFHGIVILTTKCRGMARHAPTFGKPQAQSLASIIGSFKSAATKHINHYRAERDLASVHVWQRNYYERIIRHEKEFNDTRHYIIENPSHWNIDSENPENQNRP